jgi:hypothetical protein
VIVESRKRLSGKSPGDKKIFKAWEEISKTVSGAAPVRGTGMNRIFVCMMDPGAIAAHGVVAKASGLDRGRGGGVVRHGFMPKVRVADMTGKQRRKLYSPRQRH